MYILNQRLPEFISNCSLYSGRFSFTLREAQLNHIPEHLRESDQEIISEPAEAWCLNANNDYVMHD